MVKDYTWKFLFCILFDSKSSHLPLKLIILQKGHIFIILSAVTFPEMFDSSACPPHSIVYSVSTFCTKPDEILRRGLDRSCRPLLFSTLRSVFQWLSIFFSNGDIFRRGLQPGTGHHRRGLSRRKQRLSPSRTRDVRSPFPSGRCQGTVLCWSVIHIA